MFSWGGKNAQCHREEGAQGPKECLCHLLWTPALQWMFVFANYQPSPASRPHHSPDPLRRCCLDTKHGPGIHGAGIHAQISTIMPWHRVLLIRRARKPLSPICCEQGHKCSLAPRLRAEGLTQPLNSENSLLPKCTGRGINILLWNGSNATWASKLGGETTIKLSKHWCCFF